MRLTFALRVRRVCAAALIVMVARPAIAIAGSDEAPRKLAAIEVPRAAGATHPAAGRETYRMLARQEAKNAGLPPDLAEAVMEVESGYNPAIVGASGEIGLMQVMPGTARLLGFVGTLDELAVPEVNIHLGVTYLAGAWRLAHGDICTTVMKYRAGHGETRFSFRSVDYCLSVRAKLMARGYPVVGDVPIATFGESSGRAGGRRLWAGPSAPDYNALNRRLEAAVTTAVNAAKFK
jgi:soluble lytic murein transglycosylase-like protein